MATTMSVGEVILYALQQILQTLPRAEMKWVIKELQKYPKQLKDFDSGKTL